MVRDSLTNHQTKLNYEHLCNLQILLVLACILHLLKFVHAFVKFAQVQDMFVCDLVVAVKVCQVDLFNMYCDQNSKFFANNLWTFKSLLECKHESIWMQWVLDANTRVCHLAFDVFGQHIWFVHQDLETMVTSFVIEDVFLVVESLVKN